MYATLVTIDNAEGFKGEKYAGDQISPILVEDLINKLDGEKHTLVTLTPGGEEHMAIGGDARVGLIVYETPDNLSFNNLLSSEPDSHETVSLVIGGQPGEYQRRYLVDARQAIAAAKEYAIAGTLPPELPWEHDA
ncbi:MAG TPA: hypothetical protein DGG94_01535 [Micromonosporaceae bacterium]|nr:hypothetical protein [Micromonosporaceae bacterium]HCU48510.1 hypothetical protein [Micromonosporaceae bacterium]